MYDVEDRLRAGRERAGSHVVEASAAASSSPAAITAKPMPYPTDRESSTVMSPPTWSGWWKVPDIAPDNCTDRRRASRKHAVIRGRDSAMAATCSPNGRDAAPGRTSARSSSPSARTTPGQER